MRPRTEPRGLRLSAEMIERIKAHMARLEKQRPGATVTYASTVRELLALALDAVEKRK